MLSNTTLIEPTDAPPPPPSQLPPPLHEDVSDYQTPRPVCLIGAGGSGKTTMAATMVRNSVEIRLQYEVIVWLSVGKTPCIVALLNSFLEQVSGRCLPEGDLTLATSVVRNTCRNRSILLVLDNVREVAHFDSLNLLDYRSMKSSEMRNSENIEYNGDNRGLEIKSQVLIATRHKGLIPNAREVILSLTTYCLCFSVSFFF